MAYHGFSLPVSSIDDGNNLWANFSSKYKRRYRFHIVQKVDYNIIRFLYSSWT